MKPNRCTECNKILRQDNKSKLCEFHYRRSEKILNYQKKYRQNPEVRKKVNTRNKENYALKKLEASQTK